MLSSLWHSSLHLTAYLAACLLQLRPSRRDDLCKHHLYNLIPKNPITPKRRLITFYCEGNTPRYNFSVQEEILCRHWLENSIRDCVMLGKRQLPSDLSTIYGSPCKLKKNKTHTQVHTEPVHVSSSDSGSCKLSLSSLVWWTIYKKIQD